MDVPPPRYRVVERGRRLIVIDTRGGQSTSSMAEAPAVRAGDAMPAPAGTPRLRKVRFDGTADLTTHRLYDGKGPRTIRLSPERARTLALVRAGAAAGLVAIFALAVAWPAAIMILAPALYPKPRELLRAKLTAWLDAAQADDAR